jgi:drug/metabolite transporter (DMT)-like permease
VTAVLLACLSAVLFGATSVFIRMALRRGADPLLGALSSVLVSLAVGVGALAVSGERIPVVDTLPFLLAGLIAPGVSQVFFFRAIRDAGAARVSVVVGMAPLVSVAIAIVLLGEPVEPALLVGALLIVGGGVALAGEQERPEGFKVAGLLLAVVTTVLFASRDNLVRWLAEGTSTPPVVGVAATVLGGSIGLGAYVLATRAGDVGRPLARAAWAFLPACACFGLSYVALFEAYYRGKVTVVSPLVATESLWGVVLAALLLRDSELVGRRLIAGAALVVAGGVLIGAFR